MKVFIIAGEVSGDKLGGAVMAGLRELVPDVAFDGVGGPLMQAQGLSSRFGMDELSLMGIAEILPKYFALKRRIRELAQAIIAWQPDVLLTIDSPDFCLRVAAEVHRLNGNAPVPRMVHYVAPSVWAWRPKRAVKMARDIDHVLALLPFEPPYMEAAGMECDFVGHPVVAEPVAGAAQAAAFRATYDIGDAPLLLVLPGSRRGEVTRLAARFGETLRLFHAKNPTARAVLPMARPVTGLVRELTADWAVKPILLDPAEDPDGQMKSAAFRAADLALAASGTVSLELAANATPMVIGYDMAWLTRQIISRLLRTDTVTLVNLVTESRVVPEFIGENCVPADMAAALDRILANPAEQIAAMALTMERLGLHGEPPGLRAARAILSRI